jgi:hypothetical protein
VSQATDTTVFAMLTASSVLQYVFAIVVVIGYFFSPVWMWRGIYGVAASVILHLVFRAWHNHNVRPPKP